MKRIIWHYFYPSDEVLPSLGVYQRVMRLLRDELYGVCVHVHLHAPAVAINLIHVAI